MFSQYTERAQKAINLAKEEASRLLWPNVDTGHLFLGLIGEGNGLAAVALQNFGLDLGQARTQMEQLIGTGDGAARHEPEFTPRAIQILTEDALAVARQLGHNYVGTEHILLALLKDREGLPARCLHAYNTAPEDVRNWILASVTPVLAKAPPPAGDLPYTERLLRQVLPLAAEEAASLGDDHIGTEHLLLGILRFGKGRAAEVLATRGVTLDWAREELRRRT